MTDSNGQLRDCRDVDAATQSALNAIRKDMSGIEKRLLAQEIHAEHHKDCVNNLRNDFMLLQGNFRIDIERLQKTLHTDIKMIQETLNDIIKKQAVSEAQVNTGVGIGKWLADKLPWIVAIGASFAAIAQFVKDKSP
jgi:hypothetical protein